jgi:hypothetical protein
LTPEQLSGYLELLRSLGVEEFEGLGFHVKFSAYELPSTESEAVVREPKQRPAVTKPPSLWESPELWPGGEPPKFPGKE